MDPSPIRSRLTLKVCVLIVGTLTLSCGVGELVATGVSLVWEKPIHRFSPIIFHSCLQISCAITMMVGIVSKQSAFFVPIISLYLGTLIVTIPMMSWEAYAHIILNRPSVWLYFICPLLLALYAGYFAFCLTTLFHYFRHLKCREIAARRKNGFHQFRIVWTC